MNCPECGTELRDGVASCINCGNKLIFTRKIFTDPRDGNIYKTVKIGTQTWMAENLNYECEGSIIYDDYLPNAAKYGRLYAWEAAIKACPDGWHLPTNDEWQTLVNFVGCTELAEELKARHGWNDCNQKSGNGTDAYGFAAMPGGYCDYGNFCLAGSYGYWWTGSELSRYFAYGWLVSYRIGATYDFDKLYGLSVRCLKS
jgi:uncharacterized protein (TIGR02145 family)